MKVDFGKVLTTLNGEPIKDEKEGDVTLGLVSVNALLGGKPQETASGQEKLKRFKLAEKISGTKGEVDVTAEDVSLLKDLIGTGFGTIIVGRALAMLEGEE